jgi:hypothetical protein
MRRSVIRLADLAEKTKQLAIRLEEPLLARIDAYVERLKKERPGIDVNRTDAVRSLLTMALDQLEAPEKKRKK